MFLLRDTFISLTQPIIVCVFLYLMLKSQTSSTPKNKKHLNLFAPSVAHSLFSLRLTRYLNSKHVQLDYRVVCRRIYRCIQRYNICCLRYTIYRRFVSGMSIRIQRLLIHFYFREFTLGFVNVRIHI